MPLFIDIGVCSNGCPRHCVKPPQVPMNKKISRWLPLVGGLLSLACGTMQPAATATPVLIPPTPEVVPSSEPPASSTTNYPLRYYDDEAGVSLDIPAGWKVMQSSEIPLFAEVIAPDSMATFELSQDEASERSLDVLQGDYIDEWLPAAEIESSTSLITTAGQHGWVRTGLAGDTRWQIVTFALEESTYHLSFRAPPDTFIEFELTFDSFVRSFAVDGRAALEVPTLNALVLSSGEPLTLDPALTRSGPTELMGDLFSGLVTLDPTLQIRPALAESWNVSAAGTVYTFSPSPEAHFHNGRPVIAADVVFSWQRAAVPITQSDTVGLYLGDILGLQDFRVGEASDIAGLQVIDEHTLQVTIDGPKPYFLAKLAFPVAAVVDRYQVDLPSWEEHPNGTGPFRHVQHIKDDIFIVERNLFYTGALPRLDYVVYRMYTGMTRRLYESDEVDFAGLTHDQQSRAEDPDDGLYGSFFTEQNLCTSYVTFNTSVPPFNDALVRRAFSTATDRARYVEAITNGEATLARGLLPPGMPGFSSDLTLPEYDPQSARDLLAQSTYGGAENLPEITWTLRSSGGRYSSAAALLVDMWEAALGVRVLVEGLDRDSYYEQVDAGNFGQLLLSGWCADYPDPENFIDLIFHSESAQNDGQYISSEFDRLVEAARTEEDVSERLALYEQAELLLLDDAPAIFLTHSGPSYGVWKPRVQGYVPSPIGVPQHQFMWIDSR